MSTHADLDRKVALETETSVRRAPLEARHVVRGGGKVVRSMDCSVRIAE